ncbi:Gfo/Idh/MocA family oxidoreductase [Sphingomonas sp. 1P06PA]|uniref:Gfo/Idh/MocA family protein n=1 Tax=Sphingomonas sp. 1P06PA TaxID=554121 RepID=UPI0039A59B41
MTDRIRTAFIGLNPQSHWAASAHMPALRALSDRFDVVGVANSSAESARRSAEAFRLPHAFADADALIESSEVDLVVVTVKVPHHFDLVSKAIAAGKHVYCEWPLGNGLAEAEALARLAEDAGIVAAVGTQARVAPEILHLGRLIADGYVGDVLSTTIVADGNAWGPQATSDYAYLYDASNGATMLTIPIGHTLAGVRDVLGEVGAVDARFAVRRPDIMITDTSERLTATSPDDVIVMGALESGATLSIHYRGGRSLVTGLLWEICGTEGDIRVTGANGHTQLVDLSLHGARGDATELEPLVPPADAYAGLPEGAVARNVAALYSRIAEDIRTGSRTAPSFADAVGLHRVIDRIEQAAADGGA